MKKFLNKEKGQAMLEFAVVLPIFLLIIFFIIDCAWVAVEKTAFDQGYMYAVQQITKDDLGDTDPLETDGAAANYNIQVLMKDKYDESNLWGVIPARLTVTSANASCYNTSSTYDVPGIVAGDVIVAKNITRYMDLNATVTYEIQPLTFLGKMFFGNSITMQKDIDCTRIIGESHRSA